MSFNINGAFEKSAETTEGLHLEESKGFRLSLSALREANNVLFCEISPKFIDVFIPIQLCCRCQCMRMCDAQWLNVTELDVDKTLEPLTTPLSSSYNNAPNDHQSAAGSR